MLFCTLQFLTFFSVVFILHWSMPWHRGRVWLLLVASFYFYANWNRWLACLIFVTTAMDYAIGRCLEMSSTPLVRRLLLVCSLVVNVGILVYFKYANFFLGSLQEVFRGMGASASLPVLSVIVPIGISFYTFEAINYT